MPAIQPCALLLLIGPDWQVEAASANVAMLGEVKPTAVIGRPLADLIGSKAIHTLRNRMSWLSSDESEVQDFDVLWGEVTLDLRAVRQENSYLIEAELAVESRLPDAIGMIRSMSERLSGNDPGGLAEQAMRQLSALTGFDYLFLTDSQGATVARAERSKISPPEIVDDELVRILADRDAEPVPMLGDKIGELVARAAFLAPVEAERELLAGLGVASSMVFPLRIDGQWVGALHALHPSPRRCGAERRSIAHLFAERLVARMARLGWRP